MRSDEGEQRFESHVAPSGSQSAGRTPRSVRDDATRRDSAAPPARLVIRQAGLHDLPTVVELRLALLRENGGHAVYGHLRADARERAYDVFGSQLRAPNEAIFLAERDGAVVGILRCVDTPNSPLLHPDRYCYVSSAYVRPAERRRGVLRALLERAADWCATRGLAEMRLHNVPGGAASAAWEAQGFEVVEEVRVKDLGRR